MQERHIQFNFPENAPRFWHSNDPFKTHFFNAASLLLPKGERFFIDSTRYFKSQLPDENLKNEMELFCKQEGLHAVMHLKYNEMLIKQGYDIQKLEKRLLKQIAFVKRYFSPKSQLAITMAYENFTTILAEAIFETTILQGAQKEFKRLWYLHAVEELEHKAVAFNVYRAIGGGYLRRFFTANFVVLLFMYQVISNQNALLKQDRKLKKFTVLKTALPFLWGKEGILRRMIPGFFKYLSPSFHPDRKNHQALIARWEHEDNFI